MGACVSSPDIDVSAYYWSSPGAFVLAAAGAVIGLGNVWRLPVLAGDYGGGAFLIVYLAALLLMALPLLVAELMLGRGARTDVVAMIGRWAEGSQVHRAWKGIGYLALIGAAAVLSYYSVIAGWSMAYLLRSAAGALSGLDAGALRANFLALVGDPEKGLGWHTMFVVAVTLCVAHGLRDGIEPVMRWVMVGAFVALGGLVLAASLVGDAGAALSMLRFDFFALGWRGVMAALHQAFFSLSLGVGVMLAFGAYLPPGSSLVRVSLAVIGLDLLFALGAGFVVVSLLAADGLAPAAGLQLIFQVLPGVAVGGAWVTALFFFMLVLVAFTSALALLEPLVVWLMRRLHLRRVPAATAAGLVIWFLGLGTLLSFNLLAGATLLGRTVFDWLALLSSRILLPAVGLLLCVYVGRFLSPERLAEAWGEKPLFALWRWLLRYPARIGLVLVLLHALGLSAFVDWLW